MNSIDAPSPTPRHTPELDDDHLARESRRAAEIERYYLASLVDAEPRRDLDGLARLAARVLDAPMAMIAFIDDTHLRTLATVGFDLATLPKAASLCYEVLYDGEPLICEDLTADPRYAHSTPVELGLARFYASQQLVTPSGEPIGSLCVFDPEPHHVDEGQREALRELADRVVDALELELRTRELTAVVGELRRSNEALAAFASQVSHDLRNPLAVLSGSLEVVDEMLGDPVPDLERTRPLVQRAHRSVERMNQLISDVLGLAEVGGGPRLAHVDVDLLVTEVREDLAAELAGADLSVTRLAPVVADPVQIRVVVQNLLSNAAKYTRPGEQASIRVSTALRPGWWRLTVSDRGRGVDHVDRSRIFEPFARVDETVPGTGVGLTTCRRVALAHGGRMGVEETPGGGATVWFEIPPAGPSQIAAARRMA
ncbi:GAF domain-containing sensor histidine kinase [Nocardioides sp.]|uniref:sensor histidine kinase n=1 Tax=Nocardioides sp. TaxID=35761 RepID=UPI0027188420|nr:GAF domain-containing sensor histidine kinase [Nocardioides sp.]MDO9458425.1 GAF domain-containing sensor histidine kinase [Nocardioides sp.]